MSSLAQQKKEPTIHVTYRIIGARLEHYSVLTGLDGTGVPLTYLFIEKCVLTETMTEFIDYFLHPLLQAESQFFILCLAYSQDPTLSQAYQTYYKNKVK